VAGAALPGFGLTGLTLTGNVVRGKDITDGLGRALVTDGLVAGAALGAIAAAPAAGAGGAAAAPAGTLTAGEVGLVTTTSPIVTTGGLAASSSPIATAITSTVTSTAIGAVKTMLTNLVTPPKVQGAGQVAPRDDDHGLGLVLGLLVIGAASLFFLR
jgi:hypothetical protein